MSILKIAKEYVASRALDTYSNVNSLGVEGWLRNRAVQGRKNMDVKGHGKDEQDVINKIKKDETGGHLYARYATHPATAAVAGGLAGAQTGVLSGINKAMKSRKKGANLGTRAGVGLALGAALSGGMSMIQERAHARALKGRAHAGKAGVGQKEQSLIRQLKEGGE